MADAPNTILIVEDEPGIREFFVKALALGGFNAVEASTAEGALRKIAEGLVPDGVILDLLMPGIGGLGFLRELRQEPRHRQIRVAIVTGMIILSEEIKETADELGIAVHHKPITMEQLLDLASDIVYGGTSSTPLHDGTR